LGTEGSFGLGLNGLLSALFALSSLLLLLLHGGGLGLSGFDFSHNIKQYFINNQYFIISPSTSFPAVLRLLYVLVEIRSQSNTSSKDI
jgi:hypothetical protein